MASLEDNKRTVRRTYEEGMNAGDIDFLDQVFTQDYVAHFPGKPPIVGLAEAKKAIGIFLAAFPDAVYTIEDIFAEGDRVVARWSARGTHLGEFQGIPPEHKVPPTGKPVVFGATDIYRMVDGMVAEEWNTIEQLDLMVQIGALELPGTKAPRGIRPSTDRLGLADGAVLRTVPRASGAAASVLRSSSSRVSDGRSSAHGPRTPCMTVRSR